MKKSALNILMLLSNPFTNDARVYNEASSLIQSGHKVTVVAWDRGKSNNRRQNWDGIDVVRVRTCLPAKYGLGIWPWHVFHLLFWQWRAYSKALSINKEARFDVTHCHDLDTLPVGIRLKSKFGLPLIYDAHEIYALMATDVAPRWLGSMLSRLERSFIGRTDKLITVSEATKGYFEAIVHKPVSVVMNCVPLSDKKYQPPEKQGTFSLVYIGLLDKTRSIPLLIDVVNRLPRVNCTIGGFGRPQYVEAIKEKCSKSANITFVGKVPLNQVIRMTKKADCSFLMLNPGHPYGQFALGNKQFEAMVCGRPIICTKGTYSGDLTEQETVGLAIECTEEALKQAIIRLRDDPELREKLGRNALRAAITQYNWHIQEKRLLEVYNSISSEAD